MNIYIKDEKLYLQVIVQKQDKPDAAETDAD